MIANLYLYGLGGENCNTIDELFKYVMVYARDTVKCDLLVMGRQLDNDDILRKIKCQNMQQGVQMLSIWNYGIAKQVNTFGIVIR